MQSGIATGSFDWIASADGQSVRGTFSSSFGNGGTSLGTRSKPGVAQGGLSPEDVVRRFYSLLQQHRFSEAYQLLSVRYQAAQPFSVWQNGYATTIDIQVMDVHQTNTQPVLVDIALASVDSINGQRVTKRFAGTWTLISTGDGWRLDAAQIRQLP
jgi:hypothetical protein